MNIDFAKGFAEELIKHGYDNATIVKLAQVAAAAKMLGSAAGLADDAARVTRHRVFSAMPAFGSSAPAANVFNPHDPSLAYRLTGPSQIADILQSGAVRARLGKLKGGRVGETHWSSGSPQAAGLSPSGNKGKYLIATGLEGLADRVGGLPSSEIRGLWRADGDAWVDALSELRPPGAV